jgi:hypothetical protein
VVVKFFFASIWHPTPFILLYAILHRFSYKEVAYLLFHDVLHAVTQLYISILSIPWLTWLYLY